MSAKIKTHVRVQKRQPNRSAVSRSRKKAKGQEKKATHQVLHAKKNNAKRDNNDKQPKDKLSLPTRVQAKLKITNSDDASELEADRVANLVVEKAVPEQADRAGGVRQP